MKIREATMSDIKPLAKLFHAYRLLSVSLENTGSEQSSENWLTERIKEKEAIFLIAIRGQDLLGFATLYQGFSSVSLKKYWLLNDLYVVNNARGLGIGSSLLSEVEAFSIATRSKGVELETSIDNLSAQSLYEQIGYQENTQYKSYFKKTAS